MILLAGAEYSIIHNMKIKVRITITNDKGESYMGIGLIWLLKRIEKFKSIRLAAQDMKLSYTKALMILNKLEKNLGRKILLRTRGGMARGGAELTLFAKSYIESYESFSNDIKRYAEKRFKASKKRFS